jgi:hypothetical protein
VKLEKYNRKEESHRLFGNTLPIGENIDLYVKAQLKVEGRVKKDLVFPNGQ